MCHGDHVTKGTPVTSVPRCHTALILSLSVYKSQSFKQRENIAEQLWSPWEDNTRGIPALLCTWMYPRKPSLWRRTLPHFQGQSSFCNPVWRTSVAKLRFFKSNWKMKSSDSHTKVSRFQHLWSATFSIVLFLDRFVMRRWTDLSVRPLNLPPVSYTHLTLPTKRFV